MSDEIRRFIVPNIQHQDVVEDIYTLHEVLHDFTKAIAKTKFSNFLSLKGGINLELACLKYSSEINRTTTDVDFYLRERNLWEEFIESVPTVISHESSLGLSYKVINRRGFRNNKDSDSLTIEANNRISFSIDVNMLPHYDLSQIYDKAYPKGYPVEYMIADKIKVLFSKKIYRRAKDLFDIYTLSGLKDYDLNKVADMVKLKWGIKDIKELGLKSLEIPDVSELEHAYKKLTLTGDKERFDKVFNSAFTFAYEIIYAMKHDYKGRLIWYAKHRESKLGALDTLAIIPFFNIEGILSLETATYYYRLSTHPPDPIRLLVNNYKGKEIKTYHLHLVNDDNFDNKYIDAVRGVFIATAERTICDMVRFETTDRFIYESLERYIQLSNGDTRELYDTAEYYRVKDKLKRYIDTLGEWQREADY